MQLHCTFAGETAIEIAESHDNHATKSFLHEILAMYAASTSTISSAVFHYRFAKVFTPQECVPLYSMLSQTLMHIQVL